MANSSYTYTQVLNGTGKFQMETNGAYSGGVKILQQRLNSTKTGKNAFSWNEAARAA